MTEEQEKKQMYVFEQLEHAGYEKHGNWYANETLSVNMQTKEVCSAASTCVEFRTFLPKLTFERIEEIRLFLRSFE